MSERPTPLETLQQRAQVLGTWLKDRLIAIRKVRAERDADLFERSAVVDRLQMNKQDIAQYLTHLELDLQNLLLAVEEKQTQIAAEKEQLEYILRDLLAAQQMRASGVPTWRHRMRAVQDGFTRRKRHELAKTEARIARRLEAAARRQVLKPMDIALGHGLAPDYGTAPQPPPDWSAAQEKR